MTDKITLGNLVNLTNQTAAVTTINSNNAVLISAMNNTLSRDGTQPNQMNANLDMNSNQILNLPAPGTVNSPARLIDVTTNPTIVVPPTGTSGHTVPYLDGNNTFSGTNTFSIEPAFPMPATTILGNSTGSPATAQNLTATQTTAMLNPFSSSLKGLTPSSGGGTTNFLRADGTWTVPTVATTSNFWKVSNNRANNTTAFPTVLVNMSADVVTLYNPIDGSTPTVKNTGTLTNQINSGPVAGGRDVGVTTTVTISIASPAVVSWTSHGLTAGTPVIFNTSGSLPTGINAGQVYYVIAAGLGVNSFEISATIGGSAINTSGTQTGVQTGTSSVWGAGDTVWFYFIWGSGPGINTISSKTTPMGTNALAGTGPILPSGYTHYCPSFPFVISIDGNLIAQYLPQISPGLRTNWIVRGNRFFYESSIVDVHSTATGNPPAVNATPTLIDSSPWLPSGISTANFLFDAECHNDASGSMIGGWVLSWKNSGSNDINLSLYIPIASFVAAQETVADVPLNSDRKWWAVYLTSGGVIASVDTTVIIRGYTWDN